MAKSSTAIAYAKALLEIAVAQGTVDLARSEMERVGALANGSFDLRQVFGNPTIREEERRAQKERNAERNDEKRLVL